MTKKDQTIQGIEDSDPAEVARKPQPSACWLLSAFASAAVLLTGCGEIPPEEYFEEQSQAILNGTVTAARPEVQQLGGGCTATLISPQFGVSSSHCLHGGVFAPFGLQFQGQNVSDLYTIGPWPGSLGNFGDFNLDVFVFKLQNALATTPAAGATLTPATLASINPNVGTEISIMGFGCNAANGTGGGIKRFVNTTYSNTVSHTCPGDSGGPLFLGHLAANGQLAAVVSGGGLPDKQYGHVASLNEDIAAIIRSRDADLERGIDRPGFNLSGMPVTQTSAANCRTACTNNAACKAFSWVQASNQCWLKSALAKWVPLSGVTSGVVAKNTSEVNVDRPGGNFFSYQAPDEGDCERACESDARCKAYSFTTGPKMCYLKGFPGAPVALAGVRSKVRRFAGSIGFSQVGSSVIDTSETEFHHPSGCSARCRSNASCQAWSYMRPLPGWKATCKLVSSSAVPLVSDVHWVSGTRGQAFY